MIRIHLAKVLEQKKRSMYWLAKETGASYPTIHALAKNPEAVIKTNLLDALCIALDCTPNDLLEFKKPRA